MTLRTLITAAPGGLCSEVRRLIQRHKADASCTDRPATGAVAITFGKGEYACQCLSVGEQSSGGYRVVFKPDVAPHAHVTAWRQIAGKGNDQDFADKAACLKFLSRAIKAIRESEDDADDAMFDK